MKKTLRILLVVSIVVSFFFFLRATDIPKSIELIKNLGYNALWILLSTFGAYLSGALGWKYCIDSTEKPSLIKLFIYRHTSNTIAIFNPTNAVAGEIFNVQMLKSEGISNDHAVKSVLLTRVLMIVSLLFLMILSLLWILFSLFDGLSREMTVLLVIASLVVTFFLVGVGFFFLKEQKSTPETDQPVKNVGKRWRKILSTIRNMRYSLSEYIKRRPQDALLSFFYFSVHWVLGSLEIYFILYFLGCNIKIWNALPMDMGISVVKSFGAFIPGQLGIEELGNKIFLSLVGINSYDIWLSVSILRRARQLFWSIIGFVFYIRLRKVKTVKSNGDTVCKS